MLTMQDHAVSKLIAADQLRSFTKRLRNAILSNADVASVWSPAAHVLDIKATLKSKLSDANTPAGHASSTAAEVILTLSHHFVHWRFLSLLVMHDSCNKPHDVLIIRPFTCCFNMCCVLATCPPSSNCTCLFAEVSSQCSILSAIGQCAARDVSAS